MAILLINNHFPELLLKKKKKTLILFQKTSKEMKKLSLKDVAENFNICFSFLNPKNLILNNKI